MLKYRFIFRMSARREIQRRDYHAFEIEVQISGESNGQTLPGGAHVNFVDMSTAVPCRWAAAQRHLAHRRVGGR